MDEGGLGRGAQEDSGISELSWADMSVVGSRRPRLRERMVLMQINVANRINIAPRTEGR